MNTIPRIVPSEYLIFLKVLRSWFIQNYIMRKIKYWEIIQKHPDFFNYDGTENDLRDQSGANPIIINLKKGHWYDKSRGEGGELS